MEKKRLRIAHISDLHFSKIIYNPLQIFSKRLIGNLNLLLFRRKIHDGKKVFTLPPLLKELGVTHVVITGDLTTTSFKKEFLIAKRFIDELHDLGIETYMIPGNHDNYTKRSYRKQIFYRFFPEKFSEDFPSLKEEGVTADYLGNGYYLVGMDTTLATPVYLSTGYFSPEVENSLKQLLEKLPKDAKIIVANHFPLFQNEKPKRIMNRALALQELLKEFPSVTLYLHGHTHRRCMADLRKSSFPVILDSGSVSHHEQGSFQIIDLNETDFSVQVYGWEEKQKPFPWKVIEHGKFQVV